jgi:HEAT repeat protein
MAKLLTPLICLTLLLSPGRANEPELIKLLESPDAPAAAKDDACQKLKLTASPNAVPALAALLPDPALSHSARYALESIDAPEAAAALRDALPKTTGLTKAGIIESLGQRRDRQSVDALKELARDTDEHVAAAAVAALGRIGGAESVGALRAARSAGHRSLAPLALDAMLACADGMLAGGFRNDATRVYREVHNADDAADAHRTAACRGLILAAGDEAPVLIEKALTGDSRPDARAALRLATDPDFTATTPATFASLLPKLRPEIQAALIDTLAQRADPEAAAPIAALAQDAEQPTPTRLAALRALATLGDASAVPLLATAAASDDEPIRDAARQTLSRLKADGVREAIVDRIPQSAQPERVELVRALGQRYDRQAAPILLKLTEDSNDAVRATAFQSLSMVGDDSLVPPLVRAIARSTSDDRRTAAERTLRTIASRATDAEQAARSISVALAVANPTAAPNLLRVLPVLPTPAALAALRDATRSQDPSVSDAAIRALASTSYWPAAQDLLTLSRDASRKDDHRLLALRGAIRLADEAASTATVPPSARISVLKDAMTIATRPDEKRLALSALARIPDPLALAVTEAALADKSVLEEAALATLQLAKSLAKANPNEAKSACDKILASGAGEKVVTETKALRTQLGG